MLVSLRSGISRAIFACAVVAAIIAPARAATQQMDGRAIVQTVGDALLATLQGDDKGAREARFRKMYRRYFDNAEIAGFVVGPTFHQAASQQRQEVLETIEDYLVALYSAKLSDYRGANQMRIGSEEPEGNGLLVTSQIVSTSAGAHTNLEIKWRLAVVGGQFMVRDVLIENVSMALTLRREFEAMAAERGGSLSGLIAGIREKIAALGQQ